MLRLGLAALKWRVGVSVGSHFFELDRAGVIKRWVVPDSIIKAIDVMGNGFMCGGTTV